MQLLAMAMARWALPVPVRAGLLLVDLGVEQVAYNALGFRVGALWQSP
jgi:hypothetical protein